MSHDRRSTALTPTTAPLTPATAENFPVIKIIPDTRVESLLFAEYLTARNLAAHWQGRFLKEQQSHNRLKDKLRKGRAIGHIRRELKTFTPPKEAV